MKIRVRLFARARDLADRGVLEVELPAGATLLDLKRQLAADWPALCGILERSAFALNEEFADNLHQVIPPDAEVALLPPVSGG